ncbi:MAG: hypothetical protein JXR95_06585 [Deltaproteobacteria bacterium]|nr:hypothetical protein [Deltaproteobacteria bacterium]
MKYLSLFLVSALLLSCSDDKIKPYCGDFEINQESEECDMSNFNGFSCSDYGFYGGRLNCTDSCKIDITMCESYGYCGDGIIQEGAFEECDSNVLGGKTCENQGYYSGNLTCGSNCRLVYDECEESGYCGDGVVQSQEDCDGEQLNGESCESLGYHGGELLCRMDCNYELTGCVTAGKCGDGIIQAGAGEKCDTFNVGDRICEDEGFWGGTLTCDECSLDDSLCFDPVKVSSGFLTTCAVDSTGGAWCWGAGMCGQLGDGVTGTEDCNDIFGSGMEITDEDMVDKPVKVISDRSFTDISVSYFHTCAVDSTGDAWCWGHNFFLGNSTLDSTGLSNVPVKVESDPSIDFVKITTGIGHTCALTENGDIYCWGANNYYQIQEGYPVFSMTPVRVSTVQEQIFTDVSSGPYHNCAINTSHKLFC